MPFWTPLLFLSRHPWSAAIQLLCVIAQACLPLSEDQCIDSTAEALLLRQGRSLFAWKSPVSSAAITTPSTDIAVWQCTRHQKLRLGGKASCCSWFAMKLCFIIVDCKCWTLVPPLEQIVDTEGSPEYSGIKWKRQNSQNRNIRNKSWRRFGFFKRNFPFLETRSQQKVNWILRLRGIKMISILFWTQACWLCTFFLWLE